MMKNLTDADIKNCIEQNQKFYQKHTVIEADYKLRTTNIKQKFIDFKKGKNSDK